MSTGLSLTIAVLPWAALAVCLIKLYADPGRPEEAGSARGRRLLCVAAQCFFVAAVYFICEGCFLNGITDMGVGGCLLSLGLRGRRKDPGGQTKIELFH